MVGHLRNFRELVLGGDHACPRWLCFTFDNPLRRLFHHPDRILRPYVSPGDRALDLGPGTGYFTVPLARLVGPTGLVVAADIQQPMLDAVDRRARRHGLANVRPFLIGEGRFDPDDRFDFALLFWMLHEVPDREALLGEVLDRLGEGGTALVVEPKVHVPPALFDSELRSAVEVGFDVADRPAVTFSRAAVLRKRRPAA